MQFKSNRLYFMEAMAPNEKSYRSIGKHAISGFMFLAIPFGGLFSISMGAPIISYGGQFPTMQYVIRLSYFVLFFVFSRSAFRRCSDDKQRDSSARRMFVFITFLALVGFFTILLPMQLIN